MRRFIFPLATLLFSLSSLFGQSENPENFRIELTGSAWLTAPTGHIQAGGTPIDFVKDLAAGAQEPRFYGRFIFKPTRKQRLIIEGTAVSFSGLNTIARSFTFEDKAYNISQNVSTSANVNYAFAGYQYDVFSGSYGHLGFQSGLAYVGVGGTLNALEAGISETKNFQAPVPLIGTEFRVYPIPHKRIFLVEGMMRGFPAGGYGYFVEGGASAGVRFGPFGLLAGYREMFANVHQDNAQANGVALRLKGPMFSFLWQW